MLLNERLDDPDRLVLGNEVIEALWKQSHLLAIFTFHETLHPVTQAERVNPVQAINAFHTGSDGGRHLRMTSCLGAGPRSPKCHYEAVSDAIPYVMALANHFKLVL